MDNVVYSPPFTRYLTESGALEGDPFVLIDIGCGMGIDSLWRVFEPNLVAHGFDAQEDEVERLRAKEENTGVHYHAALVGLPDDHEYHAQRAATANMPYFDPIQRSSGFAASAQQADAGRRSLNEMNSWQSGSLTTRKIGLTKFLRDHAVRSVDFVKTDTDGADYEVLLSAADAIRETDILGFMVETPLNAPPTATAHSFHNVDQFLRQQGFLLFTLSINRYSRSALPAPFAYRVLAQTTFGQVIWGDTVYLRDAGSPDYAQIWGQELEPTKLLKLACLYELFNAPDVAAEALIRNKRAIDDLVDHEHALDLLTPLLPDGRRVSYREYVSAFATDPYTFYPRSLATTAVATVGEVREGARKVGGLARRLAQRRRPS